MPNGREKLFVNEHQYLEFLHIYKHFIVKIKPIQTLNAYFNYLYPLSESPALSESDFKKMKRELTVIKLNFNISIV